jgi:hypothetical protein
MRWRRLEALLRIAGRAVEMVRRSVELDAIVGDAGGEVETWIDRFRTTRGLERGHSLLDTVLAGDGPALASRMRQYETAGATDLMLGFADFPATGMLERFALTVLNGPRPRAPGVASTTA